jgi:hypothetical protein
MGGAIALGDTQGDRRPRGQTPALWVGAVVLAPVPAQVQGAAAVTRDQQSRQALTFSGEASVPGAPACPASTRPNVPCRLVVRSRSLSPQLGPSAGPPRLSAYM